MNADRLLAVYDRVVETPDAITRLRRFVLDLAVRGKLVEQDPRDEPASELLKRIATEKARLITREKTTRAKAPAHDPVTPSFALPMTWEWSMIEAVAQVEMGQSPRSEHYNQAGDGISFFQGKADFGHRHPTPRYWCTSPKKIAECGDILVSVRAPVGPTNVADRRCCIGRGLAALRPFRGFDRDFMLLALKAFEPHLASLGFGTTFVAITKKQLTKYSLAVPPLAEQHRIVAKVEDLMAVCDRLEEARRIREKTRDKLSKVSLVRLTEPNGEVVVSRARARFFVDALPVVTARADQIKQLRQTILNLAVRGKLVQQEPEDEPASELLKRIRVEKRKREPPHNRGRSQSAKVPSDDWPYEVSSTWTWATLGEITISRDWERVPVSKIERRGRAKIYDYYGASGVIDKIDGYLFDSPLLLIGEDGANLINRSTPIAFMARGKYWVNNHAHVLDGLTEQLLRYLEIFVNATDLAPFVTGTAQPKMNKTRMNSIPVALPPLDEQLRIVAKVDELVALCDRLEACLGTIDITKSHLLDSILREAVDTEGE